MLAHQFDTGIEVVLQRAGHGRIKRYRAADRLLWSQSKGDIGLSRCTAFDKRDLLQGSAPGQEQSSNDGAAERGHFDTDLDRLNFHVPDAVPWVDICFRIVKEI